MADDFSTRDMPFRASSTSRHTLRSVKDCAAPLETPATGPVVALAVEVWYTGKHRSRKVAARSVATAPRDSNRRAAAQPTVVPSRRIIASAARELSSAVAHVERS